MKKLVEYALYKGDKFINIGTKEYLAKLLNVRKETIEFYASPTKLKRNKDNGYVVVRIDDDEREE
jgi:hypothetical protein